jgi:hypothetical protein
VLGTFQPQNLRSLVEAGLVCGESWCQEARLPAMWSLADSGGVERKVLHVATIDMLHGLRYCFDIEIFHVK